MNIKQLLAAEAAVINDMLKKNSIYAKVDPAQSIYNDPTAGFIRYALKLRQDQRFDAVERIHREMSVILSNMRSRSGLPSPIQAIPVSTPFFALEVPHPAPEVLLWSPRKVTTMPAHGMALGRSYSGNASQDETMSFASDGTCHALIVGITGAGKSVLMQNMLLSLCANTSPADLRIMLIDLKNQDMLPFKVLPHVTFIGDKQNAVEAIRQVVAEKDHRIKLGTRGEYRLVLWIDEMAQLANIKGVADMLGDLGSIGRGKMINIVGATQYPTDKGGLGGLLKANFPLRLVGMVAPGQSHIACNRGKLYADLLPGKGAFLRLQGPTVQRFQAYMIDENDVYAMADYIARNWRQGVEPPIIASPMPSQRHAETPKRDDLDALADIVGPLKAQFMSKRAICLQVLGHEYAGSYAAKIDAALKRYRERQSATTEGATTPLLLDSHTSEGVTVASSSSSDEKIIRFPKRAANG